MKTWGSWTIIGRAMVLLAACSGDEDGGVTEAPAAASLPAEGGTALAAEPSSAPSGGGDAVAAPPVAVASAARELRWRNCGQVEQRNLECTEVEVPIDYGAPNGDKVPIAMRRIRANSEEPYRGVLLFNPGGPGGTGIDGSLDFFPDLDAVAPGYDIVGFDPRGVGASGERSCGVEPLSYLDRLSAPASEGRLADALAALRELGERCEQAWGPLFRHLGSNNVVRDMEELRKALGEAKLNFYGASYGTRLGALYAHYYPESTGRMVLDASVFPEQDWVESRVADAENLLELHEQLLVECESGLLPGCPADARTAFGTALEVAREYGAEYGFMEFWRASFASRQGRQSLIGVLAAAAADPTGAWFEGVPRDSIGIATNDAGLVALIGVNCIDNSVEPPSLEQIQALDVALLQAGPILAGAAQWSGMCNAWPVERDPVPLPTARDVGPLLVIGGTRDSRTPLAASRAMAETLGNATLLTSDHYGHCAIAAGSPCVNGFTRAYLTSGSLPAAGTLCPDPVPAAAPAPPAEPPAEVDSEAPPEGSDPE